jgi:hypothetical protein
MIVRRMGEKYAPHEAIDRTNASVPGPRPLVVRDTGVPVFDTRSVECEIIDIRASAVAKQQMTAFDRFLAHPVGNDDLDFAVRTVDAPDADAGSEPGQAQFRRNPRRHG